jgi:replication-associated recombination protein RarA
VPLRRRSLIEALSRKVSVEARRLSALSSNLHDLRKALNRLTRELLVCVAIVLGIWHLLSDALWRLISSLWH